MRTLLVVAALLMAACDPGDPEALETMPGQDEAVAIVMSAYGSTLQPSVRWVRGDELNCAGGLGWRIPPHDVCGGGWFDRKFPMRVEVALPDGMAFSASSLAHELRHMHEFHADPSRPVTQDAHASGAFDPGGIVDKANEALRARGL